MNEEHTIGLEELGKIKTVKVYTQTYVDKLETENADLKKGLSVVNASNSFNKEQLAEAKEIIKKLSDAYKYVIRFEEYADKKCLLKQKNSLRSNYV